STFDASGYYFDQVRATNGGSIINAGGDNEAEIALTSSLSTSSPTSGIIELHRPGDNDICEMQYRFSGRDGSGAGYSARGGGQRNASAPVTAVRLFVDSGNLASGRVVGRFFRSAP